MKGPCKCDNGLLDGHDGGPDEIFGDPCIKNPRVLALGGWGNGIGALMIVVGLGLLMSSSESCGLNEG